MIALRIDLQDGFKDDVVVLFSGDEELLRLEAVTSRYQIGLARSETIDLPDSLVTLEINVPTRRIAMELKLDTAETGYLAVSIDETGALACRASCEPFYYM
jgi:hypothetical protein